MSHSTKFSSGPRLGPGWASAPLVAVRTRILLGILPLSVPLDLVEASAYLHCASLSGYFGLGVQPDRTAQRLPAPWSTTSRAPFPVMDSTSYM